MATYPEASISKQGEYNYKTKWSSATFRDNITMLSSESLSSFLPDIITIIITIKKSVLLIMTTFSQVNNHYWRISENKITASHNDSNGSLSYEVNNLLLNKLVIVHRVRFLWVNECNSTSRSSLSVKLFIK